MLGKHGSGALVTLAERKSRLYLVRKVSAKRATDVRGAIIDMLQPYAAHVHTITADNGSEFVEHKAIAQALSAEVYFAHPYSSWERGLNENFTACYASTSRKVRTCGRSRTRMSAIQKNS